MTDNNTLTDRDFWLNYWVSKENLVFQIPPQYPFLRELESLIARRNIRTLLEIGGFPGYYSVWAAKNGVSATLLDFVVHLDILQKLEISNGINEGSVQVIEADLFKLMPDPVFDLVLSNGLIEHFIDTADILKRHVDFVKPGGELFISLPNFRGLNGWFQKNFDPENYDKHNIQSMDIGQLRTILESLELIEIDVRYAGYFMLWFENPQSKPLWTRVFLKLTWFPIKVFFKIFPINSRAFSPYIIASARKKP